MPNEYDRLEQELDDILAKAQPVEDTDKKIEAAAEGADLPGAKEEAENKEDAEDGDAFMKALEVTLESGEKVEAYDATAMLKAMHGQSTRQAANIADLQAKFEGADRILARLPDMLKALTAQITEQGEHIKALREAPAGRRSVTAATPSGEAGKASRGDILAKALDAQKAGRIGGVEVAQIEARLNQGKPLPDHLARALGAA